MKMISRTYKFDELTLQLLSALQQHEDKKAAQVVRSAIYDRARLLLPEEEFQKCIMSAVDYESL